MKPPTELSDLIRALARRDWGTTDQLMQGLDANRWPGSSQVLAAAFLLLVQHRFTGSDLRDIASYVASTRSKYEKGDQLSLLAVEGMIRAALGEADLVDDIDPETAFSVQMFLIITLLEEWNFNEADLDTFIRDVEDLAAEHM